jgi:hypothetical protein
MTGEGQGLTTPSQRTQLADLARQRNFGLALALIGWLHLLAFSLCYYLTIAREYHEAGAYLAIWVGELCGVLLVVRLCGGPRPAARPSPLARFTARVWISYLLLAFNLCSMNTLRGHRLFEFFPATASLASFGFLMMTFTVSPRFFAAVLVMFASGLLMAAYLTHAYLIFALAWWLVLNGTGLHLLSVQRSLARTQAQVFAQQREPAQEPEPAAITPARPEATTHQV